MYSVLSDLVSDERVADQGAGCVDDLYAEARDALAGALYVHQSNFASPDSFSFSTSVLLLVMVTVTEDCLEGSATLVAVIVVAVLAGKICGAV